VGTKFPSAILALSGESLLPALVLIMVGSIVLGMGLPSAMCYLLMATLIGSVLNRLDVIPLAANLFIFYFGMMSKVTPPVALAAHTSASIAGTNIMRSSFAAFGFAIYMRKLLDAESICKLLESQKGARVFSWSFRTELVAFYSLSRGAGLADSVFLRYTLEPIYECVPERR
jgi:hypothetical protein